MSTWRTPGEFRDSFLNLVTIAYFQIFSDSLFIINQLLDVTVSLTDGVVK
jgi:hypothetical protein